jgi:hypothetical protein
MAPAIAAGIAAILLVEVLFALNKAEGRARGRRLREEDQVVVDAFADSAGSK